MLKIKRASAVDRIHNQQGTEWIMSGDQDDLINLASAVKGDDDTNVDAILDTISPLADHFELVLQMARKDQG